MLKKDDASSDTQKISRRQIYFFSRKFTDSNFLSGRLSSRLRSYLCWKIDDELAPIQLRIIDDIKTV